MRLRRAIGWTTAGTAVSQLSSLLRLFLVAAVVSIDAMGVYAIAASLTAAAGMLGDSGLRQLYLSRRSDDASGDAKGLLATVWVGIALARLLMLVLAVPLAFATSAFIPDAHALGLVLLTTALATAPVLLSLCNPAQLENERAGNFEPSVKAESYGQMTSLAVVGALVAVWPSIWLLVIGQVAGALASMVSSYLLNKPVPPGHANAALLLDLARRGRPFVVISSTTYVTASLDKLLLGAMLSPAAAGTYFLAQRIAEAPRQFYASVFGRTALPYYAWQHASSGNAALRSAVRRYLAIIASIFGAGLATLVGGKALLPQGSIPAKWEGVLVLLPLILAGVAMRAACHAVSPSLIVAGRMDIDARMKIQEAAAYLLLLPLSILAGGTMGAAIMFLAIYAVSFYRRQSAMRGLFPLEP